MQKNNLKVESILNRVHLSLPEKRDDKERAIFIPEGFGEDKIDTEDKILEKNLELENGGPGVYSMDVKKKYLLKNEEWKYDRIPEIYMGKNIADYVDENIMEKLEKIRRRRERKIKKMMKEI